MTVAGNTTASDLMPPPDQWIVINDSVMGGISRSRYGPMDNGSGRFSGDLSLENNGGFASVRGRLRFTPPSPAATLKLAVRGDGKRYQLRFRTHQGFDGLAYAASFNTEAGQTTEAVFSLADFVPTWRGRRLRNAPVLAWEDVAQIGLMISDKQTGRFSLEVLSLRWVLDT